MPIRTINFNRANYDTGIIDRNFEEVIRGGHAHLNHANDRRFIYKDPLFVKCLDYQEHDHHVLLHICAYEPGGSTLTIPDDEIDTDRNVEPEENDPPLGRDFLSKDMFVLISDNNIIYCSSGLRFSGFRVYIRNIILNFEGDRVANTYGFSKIADIDKIQYIRENDVKEIQLFSNLYQHEVDDLEERSTRNKFVQFVDELFGGRDLNLDEIENSEKIQASLSLKFDTRPLENRVLFHPFNEFSENILNEDEIRFKLKLRNGDDITSDEITHRKRIDVTKHGNSVNKYEVFNELQQAYADFLEN